MSTFRFAQIFSLKHRFVFTYAILCVGSMSACRVNVEDLKRWQSTEHGPEKLAAVLTHSKYEQELRIEAGWSLIEMKRRGGQTVGLTRLIEELTKMPLKERRDMIDGIWKRLAPKVAVAIIPAGAEGKYSDPSIIYKDAAFEIFNEDKLDANVKTREEISKILTEWAFGLEAESAEKRLQSFELRSDNTAQKYGLEKVVQRVGVYATKFLPALLTAKNAIKSQKLDAIARMAVDVKPISSEASQNETYEKIRDEVSQHFAFLLRETIGNGFINTIKPEVEAELKKDPKGKSVAENPELFKQYLDKVRDERLQYLFPVLKQVGRKPVVAALLEIASNEKASKEHRNLALAALDGNIDTSSSETLNQLFAIARSNAPDEVKHVALLRINAFAPDQAVTVLYKLFDSPQWKVRYDAAINVLTLMTKVGEKTKTTPREFLQKLPIKIDAKLPMGLGEPSTYGKAISELPNGKTALQEALLNSTHIGAQLTALGSLLTTGSITELAALPPRLLESKEPIAVCKPEDECGWDKPGCPVPKPGAKPEDAPELKPVTTLGEYIQFCVKPQIEMRAKSAPAK